MSSDGQYRLAWVRTGKQHLTTALTRLGRVERVLWALVVVGVVGDLATTYYGLRLGLAESNPVARAGLEQYGFAALVALKVFAVGVGLGCRRVLPERHALLVPAGLAVPWLIATTVNLILFVTVLL